MTQDQAVRYSVGDSLPALTRQLTPDMVARYADASGDHNPLHLDENFARDTRFGGTIAHGMLLLAFVSEVLTSAFGPAWVSSGRLKVRFRGAARPTDTITVRGAIKSVDAGRTACEVECVNQTGEVLISGEAEVATP